MIEESKLTVKITNTQPVELTDLTEAFLSFAEQYKRFIVRHPEQTLTENTKLYIKEIKTGSIIVDLIAFAPCVLPFVTNFNTVAAFTKYLKDSYGFFLRKNARPEPYEKLDLKQLSKIIEIVAKDSGSTINIHNTIAVHGDSNQINLNSLEANAAQNTIQQALTQLDLPKTNSYQKVLLYFYQARDDLGSQIGNRGIIETISKTPKKIIFLDDEIKTAILHTPKNPFHMAYVVDVDVQTIEDNPVMYTITTFHECFEREGV